MHLNEMNRTETNNKQVDVKTSATLWEKSRFKSEEERENEITNINRARFHSVAVTDTYARLCVCVERVRKARSLTDAEQMQISTGRGSIQSLIFVCSCNWHIHTSNIRTALFLCQASAEGEKLLYTLRQPIVS